MRIHFNYTMFLFLILALGLSGCGENDPQPEPSATSGGGSLPASDGGDQPSNQTPNSYPTSTTSDGGNGTVCVQQSCGQSLPLPNQYPPTGPSYFDVVFLEGESKTFPVAGKNYNIRASSIEKLGPINCITTPCVQPAGFVVLDVEIQGGCGPYSPSNCVGTLPVYFSVTLSEDNSIVRQGSVEFQLVRVESGRARLVIAPL